jgi:hypothetical protein
MIRRLLNVFGVKHVPAFIQEKPISKALEA